MSAGTKGLITRIIGPVVDVTFPQAEETPELFNSLEVETKSGKLVLEVLQQLGNGSVRCISMHTTDGLSRGTAEMRGLRAGGSLPSSYGRTAEKKSVIR